jgi:hypothetical protein
MQVLTNLPIAAFPNTGVAICAGRSGDIGQGHYIATGATVVGVRGCMDLAAISDHPIAIRVPEEMQCSMTPGRGKSGCMGPLLIQCFLSRSRANNTL